MKAISKLAFGAMVLLSLNANAENWPTKPVRFFLPSAAGSAPDVITRLLGERLSQLWKQPVIVENKPGASGVIGMSAFKQVAPDQHTFVVSQAAVIAVTPQVLANPRFDVDADMTPIATIALSPMMVLARSDLSASTLGEAIELVRTKKEQLTIGATGQFSIPHLSAEFIKKAAGIDATIVSFSSTGGAINALVNGDIQLMVDGIPGIGAMLQSGRVKALAVTSSKRLPNYPDVPAMGEALPGSQELSGWFVLFGRKNTEADIAQRINRDINGLLRDPGLTARFAALGVFPRLMSQTDTAKFVAMERDRWGTVLKQLDIRPQ